MNKKEINKNNNKNKNPLYKAKIRNLLVKVILKMKNQNKKFQAKKIMEEGIINPKSLFNLLNKVIKIFKDFRKLKDRGKKLLLKKKLKD
jgi:hypothetical protein